VIVVLGASSAGASEAVVVTFNGGGSGAQVTKSGLVVLATPTVTSAAPTAGYVSSTITLTGANFVTAAQDAAASCSATVGGTAAACALVDGTTLKVTIEAGTQAGYGHVVAVTIATAGAMSPHNVGTSAADFVAVLATPTASTFTPTAGYVSSRITVTGSNFITPEQGGDCLNGTTVGGTAVTSCTISSATSLVIVVGASSAGANVTVVVTFNGGGSGAQATKTGLVVLAAPTVTSAVPTAGYI
jgi:hypothetical protein